MAAAAVFIVVVDVAFAASFEEDEEEYHLRLASLVDEQLSRINLRTSADASLATHALLLLLLLLLLLANPPLFSFTSL